MWLTRCFDQSRRNRPEQILCDQPLSRERAGAAMQVGTGGGGIPGRHPLRESVDRGGPMGRLRRSPMPQSELYPLALKLKAFAPTLPTS